MLKILHMDICRKVKNGTIEFWDEGINEKIEFSNMSAGLKIFTVLQQLISNYSLKRGMFSL